MVFASPDNNISVGLVGLLQYANDMTKADGETGVFGVMILIIVAFVSFLVTKGFSAEKSLGFSGFLSLIVAIFLRFLNLINDGVMIIVLVIFIIIMVWLMLTKDREVGAV